MAKAVQPPSAVDPYADAAVPAKQAQRTLQAPARAYTVVGPKNVFGLKPGETGDLELTEGQAQALIQAGHLARADDSGHSAGEPKEVPK